MNSGSAFANKKSKEKRPEGDFYSTPKSLIWVAEHIIKTEFPLIEKQTILEPCAGQGAISEELNKYGFPVVMNDLYHFDNTDLHHHIDYLKNHLFDCFPYIITNPPFDLWNDFVKRAKEHCLKFMFIGKENYHGTNERFQTDIWKNLKAVYTFNRYVDYQTPYRADGLFHVGSQATAWFLWDMNWNEDYYKGYHLDVQSYAKLGAYKKKCKLCKGKGCQNCEKGYTYGKH